MLLSIVFKSIEREKKSRKIRNIYAKLGFEKSTLVSGVTQKIFNVEFRYMQISLNVHIGNFYIPQDILFPVELFTSICNFRLVKNKKLMLLKNVSYCI